MSEEQQELRNAGLKVTVPRIKILDMLEHSETKHLSAEDVFKALRDAGEEVGLATVYRVLTQFEKAGLVMRHHFEGGSSIFELTSVDHHDHIVCNKCGRVEEFFDEAFNIKMTDLVESKNETVIHLVNNIDSLLRESTGLFRQYIIDEFMIPKETDWAQIQSSKKDLNDKIEERYSQMQQSFRELSDLL